MIILIFNGWLGSFSFGVSSLSILIVSFVFLIFLPFVQKEISLGGGSLFSTITLSFSLGGNIRRITIKFIKIKIKTKPTKCWTPTLIFYQNPIKTFLVYLYKIIFLTDL